MALHMIHNICIRTRRLVIGCVNAGDEFRPRTGSPNPVAELDAVASCGRSKCLPTPLPRELGCEYSSVSNSHGRRDGHAVHFARRGCCLIRQLHSLFLGILLLDRLVGGRRGGNMEGQRGRYWRRESHPGSTDFHRLVNRHVVER